MTKSFYLISCIVKVTYDKKAIINVINFDLASINIPKTIVYFKALKKYFKTL